MHVLSISNHNKGPSTAGVYDAAGGLCHMQSHTKYRNASNACDAKSCTHEYCLANAIADLAWAVWDAGSGGGGAWS
jgi:hypothetical protein